MDALPTIGFALAIGVIVVMAAMRSKQLAHGSSSRPQRFVVGHRVLEGAAGVGDCADGGGGCGGGDDGG